MEAQQRAGRLQVGIRRATALQIATLERLLEVVLESFDPPRSEQLSNTRQSARLVSSSADVTLARTSIATRTLRAWENRRVSDSSSGHARRIATRIRPLGVHGHSSRKVAFARLAGTESRSSDRLRA